jgi:hypothetical protein
MLDEPALFLTGGRAAAGSGSWHRRFVSDYHLLATKRARYHYFVVSVPFHWNHILKVQILAIQLQPFSALLIIRQDCAEELPEIQRVIMNFEMAKFVCYNIVDYR